MACKLIIEPIFEADFLFHPRNPMLPLDTARGEPGA
jgi:hypothetical protein